jgi:hypothetical protein
LRTVLEDSNIVKVIHDCKQDGDALFHHLDIRLVNIHDTQCWDKAINNCERNLNRTLQAHGLGENTVRNCSVYDTNREFWALRPLTAEMIEWASGDVQGLFALYDQQIQLATPEQAAQATQCSVAAATEIPAMCAQKVFLNPSKMGLFIGKGGQNLQRLKERNPGIHTRTGHLPGEVIFYAKNQKALNDVIKAVQKYRS